jgi:UDP-N-acetyl-D-galactosamine dehydrogenase
MTGLFFKNSKILILGITFKEDCPDVRNTKVIDIITELKTYGVSINISDPWANSKEVLLEYNVKTTKEIPTEEFDAVILAVAHKKFNDISIKKYLKQTSVLFDVKSVLNKSIVDGRL